MYMYYICIYVRMGGFRMDSESQGFQPLLSTTFYFFLFGLVSNQHSEWISAKVWKWKTIDCGKKRIPGSCPDDFAMKTMSDRAENFIQHYTHRSAQHIKKSAKSEMGHHRR